MQGFPLHGVRPAGSTLPPALCLWLQGNLHRLGDGWGGTVRSSRPAGRLRSGSCNGCKAALVIGLDLPLPNLPIAPSHPCRLGTLWRMGYSWRMGRSVRRLSLIHI